MAKVQGRTKCGLISVAIECYGLVSCRTVLCYQSKKVSVDGQGCPRYHIRIPLLAHFTKLSVFSAAQLLHQLIKPSFFLEKRNKSQKHPLDSSRIIHDKRHFRLLRNSVAFLPSPPISHTFKVITISCLRLGVPTVGSDFVTFAGQSVFP